MLFSRLLLPTPFSRVSSFPISRACLTRKTKEKKEEEIFSAVKVSYGCISAAIWVFLFFPRHCFSPARQCKERVMGLGGERDLFSLSFLGVTIWGKDRRASNFPRLRRPFPIIPFPYFNDRRRTHFFKKKSGKFINWETECMTLAPCLQGPVFWGRERIPRQESIFSCTYFLSPKGR